MKSWTQILCGLSVLATFTASPVLAQQQPSANTTIPAPTEEQMQAMYETYYKNGGFTNMTAGDKDASLSVGSLQNAFKEEEKKTTYRYNGKSNLLYGVKLPERSFNNIDYPY